MQNKRGYPKKVASAALALTMALHLVASTPVAAYAAEAEVLRSSAQHEILEKSEGGQGTTGDASNANTNDSADVNSAAGLYIDLMPGEDVAIDAEGWKLQAQPEGDAPKNLYQSADADARTITLPECTRKAYELAGWRVTAQAVDGVIADAEALESMELMRPGATVALSDYGTETKRVSITLEAVWDSDPELTSVTVEAEPDTAEVGESKVKLTASAVASADTTEVFGDTLQLRYQWHTCDDADGNGGKPIEGGTGRTFTVPAQEAPGQYYYYCMVTCSVDSTFFSMSSKPVQVTITKPAITFQFSKVELTLPVPTTGSDREFDLEWETYYKGEACELPSSTSLSFESDNPEVAEVDPDTGHVTIKGKGIARIHANLEDPANEFSDDGRVVTLKVKEVQDELAFGSTELEVEYRDDGTEVPENPLTGVKDNAKVTYSSSSNDIATVDAESGVVSVHSAGDVTIKATTEETDDYLSGNAEYVLHVVGAKITGISVTPYEGEYNGYTHEAVEVSGTQEGDIVQYSTDGGETWTLNMPEIKNVRDTSDMQVRVKVSRANHEDYVSKDVHPRITRASVDMSGITVEDVTYIYDGFTHTPNISGNLPAGINVEYNREPINAGTYEVTVSFLSGGNYEDIEPQTATVTIKKAKYDMSNAVFNSRTVTYDGAAHSVEVVGSLPAGVQVFYTGNTHTQAGSYTVTAHFTGSGNYEQIPDMQATLTINKATYDMSGVAFHGESVTYNGFSHSIYISGELPDGVSVYYEGNGVINAGEHTVTARFRGSSNYNNPDPMTATISIGKADYDMRSVTFNDLTVTYDGKPHELVVEGKLPEGVSVTYENNTLTDAGELEAVAHIVVDANHNDIPDMHARLKVLKRKPTLTLNRITAMAIFGGRAIQVYYSYDGDAAVSSSTGGNAKAELNAESSTISILPAANGLIELFVNALESENYEAASARMSISVDRISVAIEPNVPLATITVTQDGKKITPSGSHYILTYGKPFTYSVSARGYMTEEKTVLATSQSVPVELKPGLFQVTFDTGKLRGVEITVTTPDGQKVMPDAEGNYNLTYGAKYHYSISAPGKAAKEGDIVVSGKTTVRVFLSAGQATELTVESPQETPTQSTTDYQSTGTQPSESASSTEEQTTVSESIETEVETQEALATESILDTLPSEGSVTTDPDTPTDTYIKVDDTPVDDQSMTKVAQLLIWTGASIAIMSGAIISIIAMSKHKNFDKLIAEQSTKARITSSSSAEPKSEPEQTPDASAEEPTENK